MADSNLRQRVAQGAETGQEHEAKVLQASKHTGRSSLFARCVLVAVTAASLGLWLLGSEITRGKLFQRSAAWTAIPAKDASFTADKTKQDAIVDAFKHSWAAYERDAMGNDEYHPIGKKGSNLSDTGGIGYAVIDAIDTMKVMGLDDEYDRARAWIAEKLTFDRDDRFNTFEITIRVLGGLLSAYHLSDEDPIFLERAVDLADRMLPAFDTPSGLPLPMVNLHLRKGFGEEYSPFLVSTAEATTLQLEFRYLSYLTDNEEYWYRAEKAMKVVKDAKIKIGLAPIYMGAENGQFTVSDIRLGSRGDSFYEYLLKQYLQTNRTEDIYRQMYKESMDATRAHLLRKGVNAGNIFTIELLPELLPDSKVKWTLSPKQDHLVCFLGGSLMLGAVRAGAFVDSVSVPPKAYELTDTAKSEWNLGNELIKTCVDTYDSPTGLSPEIAHFYIEGDGRDWKENRGKDWYVKGMEFPNAKPSYDARYILRPETVESLFIAFRLTGDHRYRDYGWKIFKAIDKHCRIESGGYASILDVMNPNSLLEDKMETFFLSETLKYLYLLFSDASVIPLDKYVFNTEAHPLPIFYPSIRTGFS